MHVLNQNQGYLDFLGNLGFFQGFLDFFEDFGFYGGFLDFLGDFEFFLKFFVFLGGGFWNFRRFGFFQGALDLFLFIFIWRYFNKGGMATSGAYIGRLCCACCIFLTFNHDKL